MRSRPSSHPGERRQRNLLETKHTDRPDVRHAAAELAADLRDYVEWMVDCGADSLPATPLESAPGLMGSSGPVQPRPYVANTPPQAQGQRRDLQPPARPTEPGARPLRRIKPGDSPLAALRQELGDCQRCALHESRQNLVFGVGNECADLVIVGEAPGRDEDRTGIPFVGRAGQLLTRMLFAIGVPRDEAYICNVLKCRPPQNRDPQSEEVATCSPFLKRQIEAIQPKAIMTVGKFASQSILGVELSMGRMRGTTRSFHGIPVVPTYHPAYLLRNPVAKQATYEDLLRVKALLRGGL
jgi:uracil-DNA glycosylase family 4